jgi:arylformamidase
MQVVDLSVLLNERTPVYPGDTKTKIEAAGVLEKDGFTDHLISMGTHVGTHVDAPMHMIAGGKGLDQIPPEQFIGRGRYIKVESTFDLDAIKSADIQSGDIVLFHTGMSDHYHEPGYFEEYPVMSEDVAEYLVSQKVKMVGLDNCSADNSEGFPIHKILLASDVLIIENLTNLASLSDKNFMVYALPLKLEVDGSPARVIATIV